MRATVAGLLLLLGCAPAEEQPDPPEPFTLAVLPDVQYLTLDYPEILDAVTEWTAAVAGGRRIVYLLQEGDVTHNNTQAEWDNAAASFALLDGLPYTVCVGNHDMGSNGDTSLFNAAFPLGDFADMPGFGGTREAGRLDDHWLTFEAGGGSWLVLSLSWDPGEDVVAWADGVVGDHPDHRVIVLTHAYLGPDGTRTSIGERIWAGALQHHANPTLVFNGHYIGGQAAHLVSTGDDGNQVAQVFANYQTNALGGAGMMRLVEVDPVEDRLSVTTYSPFLDASLEDEANQFSLDLPLGPIRAGTRR